MTRKPLVPFDTVSMARSRRVGAGGGAPSAVGGGAKLRNSATSVPANAALTPPEPSSCGSTAAGTRSPGLTMMPGNRVDAPAVLPAISRSCL